MSGTVRGEQSLKGKEECTEGRQTRAEQGLDGTENCMEEQRKYINKAEIIKCSENKLYRL
jgi:hypothetical protein